MNDLEIIKNFQNGNLDFFGKLYDKYIDEIYKFVYLKTTNKEISEDIVSETFLSAFRNLDSFDISKKSNFRAWIYKISYNKVIDFYNKKDRDCDICEYLDLSFEEDLGQKIDNKDKILEVKKYLENTKKRDRDILIYRIWHDLSYKEISEIMGISIENCRKIVSRILKKISLDFIFALLILLSL